MPPDAAKIRPLHIIMAIVGISLVVAGGWLFNGVWQQNTFPKGEKAEGREYTVEGRVYKGFSTDSDQYYNATDNTTMLPVYAGELVYSYKLPGDQRGRFRGEELVVLTTVWNGSLDEKSQLWTAKRYDPPHQQFAILSYVVFLGLWSVLTTAAIRAETDNRMAAAIGAASILPTMLYIPAYFFDMHYLAAYCTVFSVVLFIAFLAVVLKGFRHPVKNERKKRAFKIALAAVISSFVTTMIGMAVGVACAQQYAGGFF